MELALSAQSHVHYVCRSGDKKASQYSLITAKGMVASHLCRLCENLRNAIKLKQKHALEHQPDFAALVHSADQGCCLCRILMTPIRRQAMQSIPPGGNRVHEELDKLQAVRGFLVKFSDFSERYSLKFYPQGNPEGQIHCFAMVQYPHGDPEPPDRLPVAWPEFMPYKRWIDDCINCKGTHMSCLPLFNRSLPTRVIQILDNDFNVRIMESRGQCNQYVALSHCWGDGASSLRTIKENFQAHQVKISFKQLPKTFQDAVRLTKALGYRYLWIDSLCIIQDDDQDWQNECGKMQTVYEHAVVTIAAWSARDANEGFLNFRSFNPFCKLDFTKGKRLSTSLVVLPGYYHNGVVGPSPKSASATRGWAFQERFLSPRLLIFDGDDVWFECSRGLSCELLEDKILGPRSSNFRHKDDLYPVWMQWCHIVSEFSRRNLTRQSDRLPALSGLAQKFAGRKSGSRFSTTPLAGYVAGLWTSHLAQHLLWYTAPGGDLNPPKPSNNIFGESRALQAPSWSWASCTYGVQFLYNQVLELNTTYPIEVSDINVKPFGLDRFGDVQPGGTLTLTGQVIRCSLWINERTGQLWFDAKLKCVRIVVNDSVGEAHRADFYPDNFDSYTTPVEGRHDDFICLLIMVAKSGIRWSGLALSRSEESGMFKRIGLCTDVPPSRLRSKPEWDLSGTSGGRQEVIIQ